MTSPIESLDDLFAEAKEVVAERVAARISLKAATKVIKLNRETYSLPENWERRRGIALIHEESSSLIGNYSEWFHKRIPGCRKLVREDTPIAIDHTERIKGWEHLGEIKEHLIEAQRWTSERKVLMELTLAELGVHAEMVELKVCLSFGGIVRVELMDHTTFSSLDGRTILTIPRGVNVLETMGIDSKVALRKELASSVEPS